MSAKRLRNLMFLLLLFIGFLASREATLRGAQESCSACTGIFGETCEPCEGGEDCAKQCAAAGGDCVIYGEVCWPRD